MELRDKTALPRVRTKEERKYAAKNQEKEIPTKKRRGGGLGMGGPKSRRTGLGETSRKIPVCPVALQKKTETQERALRRRAQ